jgi:Uma2 family endonuclease
MATQADQLRMTLAEFLIWDDGTDARYELVDGRIVSMAPPNDAHGTIVASIGFEIRNQLRPPRRVATGAGILRPNRDDSYYVADLGVTCGPAADTRQYLPEPVLIVEVLSPSTEDHDRGRKVTDYREIPSLQEILVVSSQQRRVELWRREGDHWRVEDLIGEASVRLESSNASIPLAAIYANVALAGADQPEAS